MALVVLIDASGRRKCGLLRALAGSLMTQSEAGRIPVCQDRVRGGAAQPWADRIAFRDRAFWRSVAACDRRLAATALFDRSFVEAQAHGPPTLEIAATLAARRFTDPVLVCPP